MTYILSFGTHLALPGAALSLLEHAFIIPSRNCIIFSKTCIILYGTCINSSRNYIVSSGTYISTFRVGYSRGAREPGSHKIFRLPRNFRSISRSFGTNLTSRSQEETSWHCKRLIATGRNLLSQKGIFYQG